MNLERDGITLDMMNPESSVPGLEVRTYFVRGRNALVARADFGELYVDYYLHQGQHGRQHRPEDDEMLKEALAAMNSDASDAASAGRASSLSENGASPSRPAKASSNAANSRSPFGPWPFTVSTLTPASAAMARIVVDA